MAVSPVQLYGVLRDANFLRVPRMPCTSTSTSTLLQCVLVLVAPASEKEIRSSFALLDIENASRLVVVIGLYMS